MAVPKDFECPVCFKLLYKPVTTSCGHNFCKTCIDQAAAYRLACPLCRQRLSSQYSPNILLFQLLNETFADEMRERAEELITQARENESVYRDRVSRPNDDSSTRPVIYTSHCHDYLFPSERRHFVLKRSQASRLMPFLRDTDKLLIILPEKRNGKRNIGALAQYVGPNRMDDEDEIQEMVAWQTTILERIEVLEVVNDPIYDCPMARYSVVHDDFTFPGSTDQNHEQELVRLHISILTYSHDLESLVTTFVSLQSIASSDTTAMDRYSICCELIKLCGIVAKTQLNITSPEGQRHFSDNYSQLMVLGERPTSGEIESASLFYARLLIADSSDKIRWYHMTDTLARLLEVSSIYVYAGDKYVLQLEPEYRYSWFSRWLFILVLLLALIIQRFIIS
ncbi:Zinc finger C3HC4 type (RING finger) family protein [Babesia bovis T2Bo]|nr:Zinc finger C3HC4 type (RING finger) family protein [Babesia bovis T2Bo]EDO06023.2 Zinc finger C3HC4 type (RING finger) family protein [Babesia bovis T2Bo]